MKIEIKEHLQILLSQHNLSELDIFLTKHKDEIDLNYCFRATINFSFYQAIPLLLEKGALLKNKCKDGNTYLHLCVVNPEIVYHKFDDFRSLNFYRYKTFETLLFSGSPIDTTDDKGRTVLALIAEVCHNDGLYYPMAQLLIEKGASCTSYGKNKHPVVEISKKITCQAKLIELLITNSKLEDLMRYKTLLTSAKMHSEEAYFSLVDKGIKPTQNQLKKIRLTPRKSKNTLKRIENISQELLSYCDYQLLCAIHLLSKNKNCSFLNFIAGDVEGEVPLSLLLDEKEYTNELDGVKKDIKNKFINISNDFLQALFIQDQYRFRWGGNKDNQAIKVLGEFNLKLNFPYNIYQAIETAKIKVGQQLCYFDSHYYYGDYYFACLEISDNQLIDSVYVDFGYGKPFVKTNLIFSEYIRHTIFLLGMYNWPYLFCEEIPEKIKIELKYQLDSFANLFPNKNLDEYFSKLVF